MIEQLIQIISELVHEMREERRTDKHIINKLDIIMTALETLTASVNANTTGQAALTTAVNAAIVQLGTASPTDAQLLSLSTAVDANTASDTALTTALNAAVTPVVPTPPPAP